MPPPIVWEALSRTEEFPRWWGWLRGVDAGGLTEGRVVDCQVRAPLPYTLRFAVSVRRVVPHELVDTEVSGDIAGPARLELSPDGAGGTIARLVWAVEVRDRALRAGAVVARPLLEWGHEWVVATGVRQFRRRALPAPQPRGSAGD